jgi:hypothetical protein
VLEGEDFGVKTFTLFFVFKANFLCVGAKELQNESSNKKRHADAARKYRRDIACILASKYGMVRYYVLLGNRQSRCHLMYILTNLRYGKYRQGMWFLPYGDW